MGIFTSIFSAEKKMKRLSTAMALFLACCVSLTVMGQTTTSLVTNPGFEAALSSWSTSGSGAIGVRSSTTLAHSGSYYLEMTATSGQHPTVFASAPSGSYFAVTVGEVVKFGGYVYRVSGNGYARFMLIAYDSNKANPKYISPTPSNATSASWVNQAGTYTVPSGVAFVRLYAEVYQATTSTTVRFDDAVLSGTVSTTSTATTANKMLLGIRHGDNGTNMTALKALEAWQAKKNAVVLTFSGWCNTTSYMDSLFNKQLINLWNNRNIPAITWEAYMCDRSTTPADIESRAANGQYDTYLKAWAARMKKFLAGADGVYGTGDDRRAYIRMPHEMNGNWYPWSPTAAGESPWQYVQMFRHVHDIFEAQGIDSAHLQFMWIPNCSGPYRAEDFYPGDAYVDWVGLDGYNFGTYSGGKWMTPAYRLDNMVGRLKALTNKPIALAETGSSAHTSTGTSYSAKDQWIKDVFAYALQNDIRMVLYFNRDVGADFTMFGGSEGTGTYTYGTTKYNVFTGYKQAISPSSVIPSDPNNPRLLTDSQFAGKL